MKKMTLFLALLFAAGTTTFAQDKKETKTETKTILSPRMTSATGDVSVSYGQPSKKGRVIFGDLVPYGQVWRTGANEATEITFKKDVVFGGKEVKAGTYTLFTIPTQESWTVILNSELKQWGAYNYEKIKPNNVAEVSVPVAAMKKSEEKLTMKVDKKGLWIGWDMAGVSVPIEVK